MFHNLINLWVFSLKECNLCELGVIIVILWIWGSWGCGCSWWDWEFSV